VNKWKSVEAIVVGVCAVVAVVLGLFVAPLVPGFVPSLQIVPVLIGAALAVYAWWLWRRSGTSAKTDTSADPVTR
jgi:membrane protein implicated in regulation of membrane protease activity